MTCLGAGWPRDECKLVGHWSAPAREAGRSAGWDHRRCAAVASGSRDGTAGLSERCETGRTSRSSQPFNGLSLFVLVAALPGTLRASPTVAILWRSAKKMEIRPVTLENLDAVVALEVSPEQTGLVADNLYTIAQAGMASDSICRVAYVDDEPVGFFAVQKVPSSKQRYIWRYMVDARHQGQGFGKRMMAALLSDLFSDPNVELVHLTVVRKPGCAEPFYEKCGFSATGEQIGGEWRMVLPRDRYFRTDRPNKSE